MAGLRLRCFWLVLLAAGAIGMSAPPVASAAFPGRNGRILYIDKAKRVVSVSPGGGHDRVLARPRHGVEDAAYKWDGRKIVFPALSPITGPQAPPDAWGAALYIKRASGLGRARRITRPFDPHARRGADEMPDWSPDGQSIVFVRDYDVFESGSPVAPQTGPCAGAPFCIRIYHRGRSRALVASGFDPVWSTRGLIAFKDEHDWIWVIRPDGSHKRRVVEGNEPDAFDWSPDGRRLVFVDFDDKLRTVGADGRHVRRLGRYGGNPVFSPDGHSIAYTDDEHSKLYTIDLQGHHLHRVRTRYSPELLEDWQPLPRRRHR